MSDTCKACGDPKPADKFRACPDCRRAWREASRIPGGHADVADALKSLVAELDGLHERGAFYPTGFPAFNAAFLRAKSVLKARRAVKPTERPAREASATARPQGPAASAAEQPRRSS